MTNASTFGEGVISQAAALRASGLDANQIAGILCKADPQGKNYGIGILLGKDGKPLPTSPTLLAYAEKELKESVSGSYCNSDAFKQDILTAVLDWQGVPEAFRPHFQLLLPSDAGTGAVQTAIQAASLLQEGLKALAVEEFGWPAYKALAASARLQFQEFPSDGVASGVGALPLYQAGPLNTTGKVPSATVVKARAAAARAAGVPVILDRAYSGFEYARRLGEWSFADLMKESFKNQLQPFIDAGVPFLAAVSPTKAFVTFSLRPCGFLLVFHPDLAKAKVLAPKLSGLIRARGSSFEHPITRAFVKAMVKDRAALEAEHAGALRRTAEAEQQWLALAKGTPIEPLFTDAYAGLFRNPQSRPGAEREIYGAHLYPVFAQGRCRLNVTGLPSDPTQASAHVAFFAKYLG
jgi:aspartate/tyrosine/aromatic aminotransferase